MNLFDLAAKISLDTSGYDRGIKEAQSEMKSAERELASVTERAKKTAQDYRSDVMKLANVYKQQGLEMSEAMKRAYSEIDKSQYDFTDKSEKSANKFSVNWENAGDVISKVASKAEKGFELIAKASVKVAEKAIEAGEKIIAIGEKASKTFIGIETAIGTAVASLVKTSVEGYGSFEQLVGGVETLFGAGGKSIEEYAESVGKSVDEVQEEYNTLIASQSTVIENAAGAFKTAGLSANDYMQTVTSFSASLLQGLGGDTVKAAEYADIAITDMADNANKMGTDIGAIQYAYQGFAKQNYTMLDNLKLGKIRYCRV